MRLILTGLVVLTIGVPLGAGEALAQPKGPLPGVRPTPTPPPAGTPGGFGSVPAPQREIRITGPDGTQTRVIIEPGPTSGGGPAAPNAGPGFGSVPSFSRERRIRIEEPDGTSREFLIQESGPPVDSPIVILPIR